MSALPLQHVPSTTAVDQTPRPEYPQPQFRREEWLNLNGPWSFTFDDDNRGVRESWFREETPFEREIVVPFCFESPKSGIGDCGFHAVVWYRRSFEVPAEWGSGRRLLLHFGAVDYRATVWVNGMQAGQHEGGHTPFQLEITALLQTGENTITVRVEDPPQDRYIPRGKQHWKQNPESIFYSRTTGIWQTVWLEPVGSSYLERVRIETTIEGAVTIDAKVESADPELQLYATIYYQGKLLASSMSMATGSQAAASAFLRDPHCWSPAHPELYDVTLELTAHGRVVDRVHTYFGFRTIRVQDGKVLLNGEPCFLKLVLDQGYWPDTNLTPPSDEAIRYDIQMAKDMGFNGVRKHQKIEDPRFLYWADRMGLMVSAEMANAYMFDDESVSRVTREWIDAMRRDYNHPSIVIWVPLNESWGVPDIRDPRQQAHIRAMYMLTKSLDATRLVIDNDGWEHTSNTDLFAIHDYSRTGDLFYDRFKSLEDGHIPVPFQGKLYLSPGTPYNGTPIFLSEFGGISYKADPSAPKDSWGYEGVEASEAGAMARMRSLYEAIAKLSSISAVCYTQLTDVEQEINGLLTYDRRPKFDVAEVKALNALLR